jgi:nucleotide-binding universal stress UspA family protein
MTTIHKVLCPVDFSGRTQDAARYAHSLSARFGAELELLYVIEPNAAAWGSVELGAPPVDEIVASLRTAAEREIQAILAGEAKVSRTIEYGNPAERIVEHAKDTGADLIVMATHGRG